MKKMIIGITVGIIITIIIGTISILIYTKFFMFVPDKDGMINTVKFKDMTITEWQEKISRYHNCNIQNVKCYYIDNEFIASVFDESGEHIAYYSFNDETGYGLNTDSGDVVNFLEGKVVEVSTTQGTTIKFTDNIILAIGYIPDIHLEEFIHKNFVSEDEFKMVSVNDFRHENERVDGNGNRFIFIPKTSDVKVEIYDCFVNNDGKLELDNTLISNSVGSFIILDDYMPESTTPTICIKLKYHEFEDIIPIVFSGEDGKLNLTGHETAVQDISIY